MRPIAMIWRARADLQFLWKLLKYFGSFGDLTCRSLNKAQTILNTAKE